MTRPARSKTALGKTARSGGKSVKRWLRDNGLSLVMLGIFIGSLMGQSITGLHYFNDEQREHLQAPLGYFEYLRTGHFLESVFENWESEFLQMGAFVLFAAFLYQRGSAESKDPDERQEADDPKAHRKADSPWPVHRGGVVLGLYSHSLTIALFALFIFSFVLHAVTGLQKANAEALSHGMPSLTLMDYVGGPTFWFESFQNWQSEFLSVCVLVVLSIFLRQRGSSQSKPVHAAHAQTGSK